MSDAAIATLVTGLVTITTLVVGFLTLWVKLKYGVEKAENAEAKARSVENKVDSIESKVDDNTRLTKAGTAAATRSAQEAANNTKDLVHRFNGDMDSRIRSIVKEYTDPLANMFKARAADVDKNMQEIKDTLSTLMERTAPKDIK